MHVPVWVTILLDRPLTPAEVAALPLTRGFLAWVEEGGLPDALVDTSASEDPPASGGVARLHISGGTNELEIQGHQDPPALRKMKAELRDGLALMTRAPGDPAARRIISAAGAKVEDLTALLKTLCQLPFAIGVVLPQANHLAFSAREFRAMADEYGPGQYHFPLYVYTKIRGEQDGPYAVTIGLFLFGLPDLAIPLGGLSPAQAAHAMGQVQNEMVAEGWWPEHGAQLATALGPVAMERVGDGVFLVPTSLSLDGGAVAVARHRFALERATTYPRTPTTRHRVRRPDLVCDHLLRGSAGESYAMTVGLSLTPQRGGSASGQNDLVEIVLETRHIGPWATGWLAWIASAVRDNDGTKPLKAWDRVVSPAPEGDLAGVILWPRGPWPVLGRVIHTWSLVPFLASELAQFRAAPGQQDAWLTANASDVPALLERWSRVAR